MKFNFLFILIGCSNRQNITYVDKLKPQKSEVLVWISPVFPDTIPVTKKPDSLWEQDCLDGDSPFLSISLANPRKQSGNAGYLFSSIGI
jgi:hypothetical protein